MIDYAATDWKDWLQAIGYLLFGVVAVVVISFCVLAMYTLALAVMFAPFAGVYVLFRWMLGGW